jgi:hypothetical protein
MKNIIILIAVLLFPYMISAQINTEREVINSTGNTYKGETISLDYSVGEAIAGTIKCPTITLNQGFIQADETKVGVQMDGDNFSIEVYPNPTYDKVKLIISTSDVALINDMQIKLTGVNGNIIRNLQETNISKNFTKEIDMTDLPSGSYYISITNNSIIKLIKIVKLK